MENKSFANDTMQNLEALHKQVEIQEQATEMLKDDKNKSNPEQNKNSLFMLNNNIPQSQTVINQENAEIAQTNTVANNELKSYGKASFILAILAVLFGILLIVAYLLKNNADASSVTGLVYLIIGGYALGMFCSVACSIVAGILGIIAVAKSSRYTISWVGCITSVIVLLFVVILVGYVLLN